MKILKNNLFDFKIILSSLLLIIMLGCTDHCPDDKIFPPFDETDLDWFSFVEGDSIFFRDATSGKIFFLLCVKNEISLKTEFIQTEDCAAGGYNETEYVMTNDFESDIPHSDNTNLILEMEVGKGYNKSNIRLDFIYGDYGYDYNLRFNNWDETLQALSPGWSETALKDTIVINETVYYNAYAIRWIEDPDRIYLAYYDSIYYNKDGFLKFISSQHGYILERLP